jgi:hypothetical protein
MHTEGTHAIAAEQQQFPPLDFNTGGWPYWLKHVVILRTFKNFNKSFQILNVNL